MWHCYYVRTKPAGEQRQRRKKIGRADILNLITHQFHLILNILIWELQKFLNII